MDRLNKTEENVKADYAISFSLDSRIISAALTVSSEPLSIARDMVTHHHVYFSWPLTFFACLKVVIAISGSARFPEVGVEHPTGAQKQDGPSPDCWHV